jgi:hypothetical protein
MSTEAAATATQAVVAAATTGSTTQAAAATTQQATTQQTQTTQAAQATTTEDVLGTVTPVEVEFKVPEGVKPDDALIAQFKPIAKELGLKSEGAQKLVDLYAATVKAQGEAQAESFKQAQTKWQADVKSDKELGGQNFDSMKVEVARFFNAFDKDGSIRGAIREMGLGNHPALVRLAFRAAKLLKEDSGAGDGAGGGEPSDDDILRVRYPSMFKQ